MGSSSGFHQELLRGLPVPQSASLVCLEFPAFAMICMLLLAVGALRFGLTGLIGWFGSGGRHSWGLHGGDRFLNIVVMFFMCSAFCLCSAFATSAITMACDLMSEILSSVTVFVIPFLTDPAVDLFCLTCFVYSFWM